MQSILAVELFLELLIYDIIEKVHKDAFNAGKSKIGNKFRYRR